MNFPDQGDLYDMNDETVDIMHLKQYRYAAPYELNPDPDPEFRGHSESWLRFLIQNKNLANQKLQCTVFLSRPPKITSKLQCTSRYSKHEFNFLFLQSATFIKLLNIAQVKGLTTAQR
jgi:hypothetical protein